MIRTIVKPTGSEIDRLKANTGFEQYTINAKLEERHMERDGKVIHVYLFHWQDVEEEAVRHAMARNFALANGMSYTQATKKLYLIASAIPVNEVEITEIENE